MAREFELSALRGGGGSFDGGGVLGGGGRRIGVGGFGGGGGRRARQIFCPQRHPSHFEPSFLELNRILRRVQHNVPPSRFLSRIASNVQALRGGGGGFDDRGGIGGGIGGFGGGGDFGGGDGGRAWQILPVTSSIAFRILDLRFLS